MPSVPDQTTLAVYALPWMTAESLVEDICDRMGLIRRLTIGGETKGKGRDKWGGGEKVVYGLEEVWDAERRRGGHEGELGSSDRCSRKSAVSCKAHADSYIPCLVACV